MTADPNLSRRALLASGVALSTAMAGCSGGDESAGTPAQTEDTTPTSGGTPEPTESVPSLSEFDYPEGATQDGIDSQTLYSTHESTVTDAGSVTFTLERIDSFDGDEFTTTTTNEFSSGDVYREIEENDGTEFVWSPSGDDLAYVQMESGFETDYRIDNESPSNNEATGLQEVRRTLSNGTWEAVEVVESQDGFAVVYEGSSSDSTASQNGWESSEGTVTVEASGYVSEVDYTITYPDGFTTEATGTVSSLGETTAEAPAWLDTAREEGVQFTSSLTDAGTAFRLEMVNGSEISSDTRLSLRDNGGRGDASLPSALTAGDVLYIGLSDSNELLTETDGAPNGARELRGFTRVDLRQGPFTLFVAEQSLR